MMETGTDWKTGFTTKALAMCPTIKIQAVAFGIDDHSLSSMNEYSII